MNVNLFSHTNSDCVTQSLCSTITCSVYHMMKHQRSSETDSNWVDNNEYWGNAGEGRKREEKRGGGNSMLKEREQAEPETPPLSPPSLSLSSHPLPSFVRCLSLACSLTMFAHHLTIQWAGLDVESSQYLYLSLLSCLFSFFLWNMGS